MLVHKNVRMLRRDEHTKDGAWPRGSSEHTGAYERLSAAEQAEEGWRDSEGLRSSDLELEREVSPTI